MKEFTLRELCEKCRVTRRAVQGYEKYGLIRSCEKTHRCYLLYDEKTVKKVYKIKSLQNYGFTVAEIKMYFGSNTDEQKVILMHKLEKLKEKSLLIISYIKEIEILLNQKEN